MPSEQCPAWKDFIPREAEVLEVFWLSQLGEKDAAGIYWVETSDAAELPTVPRTAPPSRNQLPGPAVLRPRSADTGLRRAASRNHTVLAPALLFQVSTCATCTRTRPQS